MNKFNNPSLTKYAQRLRKDATPEERKLWYQCLNKSPIRFHRQKVIGKYIVDFYCAKAKLVVEIDGTQHFLDKGKENDKTRDEFLRSLGLTVVRIPNNEIWDNFDGVCTEILSKIGMLGEK